VPCQGIQTPDPPPSVPQLPGYLPEEHLASLVGYPECPLGEPLGLAQEELPEWQDCSELGDSIHYEHCLELAPSPALGVGDLCALGDSQRREDCSELGGSPGLRVEDCSVLGNLHRCEDCSELGGSPALEMRDCSELGDSEQREDFSEI